MPKRMSDEEFRIHSDNAEGADSYDKLRDVFFDEARRARESEAALLEALLEQRWVGPNEPRHPNTDCWCDEYGHDGTKHEPKCEKARAAVAKAGA